MENEYKSVELKIDNPQDKANSVMIIGNFNIYNDSKFNRLQRFMWKKFFNIEIKNLKK